MHHFLSRALTHLVLLCALLLAAVPASAQTDRQPATVGAARVVADFFGEIGAYYDTADTPALVNDHAGRLVIYRETLRRLEAAPPSVRAHPRYRRNQLFYAVAVATTMTNTGEAEAGAREIDRLLPEVRAFVGDESSDIAMVDALVRLLRSKGQTAQVSGDRATALPLYRQAASLTRVLIDGNHFSDRAYGERSLAIDLDNLANMEALAGNRAEADSASAQALDLFRSLAAQAPDSRPAQGSLLIALLRRAIYFNEIGRLDEAERQIAVMRERGQLIDQYARIAEALPSIRAEIAARIPPT